MPSAKVEARIATQLKKYCTQLEQAKQRDVNESDTCSIIRDMLFDVLGYDKNLEVTSEHNIRNSFVDLAVQCEGKINFLIEAKAIGITLRDPNHMTASIMVYRDTMSLALQEASPYAIEVPVVRVFDGDGFLTNLPRCHLTGDPEDRMELEVAVRFGFIDAPELEQRGGHEAKEYLQSLIGGRRVLIDVLTKMDTGTSFDRHGRVVAVPYVVDRQPLPLFGDPMNFVHRLLFNAPLYLTRNVEIEMLLNGWAWVLERYEPEQVYFDALQIAQTEKRGIWAHEDNVHPWAFKRQEYNDRPRHAEQSRASENCPANGCSGKLVRRNGRYGAFYGCSKFPACKYSRSIR